MTALRATWTAYLDRQHRYPNGVVGWAVGERMRRQHMPETDWSIDLLQLAPTDRVLELGFGVGRGLALALQRAIGGHVAGLDASATMIRAAMWRNRAALEHGRLSLLRGDIATLPFGKQHFDKILSIHTFYFWPDPGAVCRQLSDLLAQGGRAVCTFATAETLSNGERVYSSLHERAQALVHELRRQAGVAASLAIGPDSRQYNNVAIVIEKANRAPDGPAGVLV